MGIIIEQVIKWGIGILLGAVSTLFLIFKKDIVEYINSKEEKEKKNC